MLARDLLRVQVYQRTCLPALARRGQQWSSKYYRLLSANPLPSPLSTTFSLLSSRPPSAIAHVPKVLKPCSAYPKKAPHKLFSLCNILWKCIICTLKCIATSKGSLEQWHCILFPCQVLPLIHNAAKMSAAWESAARQWANTEDGDRKTVRWRERTEVVSWVLLGLVGRSCTRAKWHRRSLQSPWMQNAREPMRKMQRGRCKNIS